MLTQEPFVAPPPEMPGGLPGFSALELMLPSYIDLKGPRRLPQDFYTPIPPYAPMPGPSPREQQFREGLPPGFFGAPVASNALQQQGPLFPPGTTFTLADLIAANDNAKGGGKGGVRTLRGPVPSGVPGVATGDDYLPPRPADNTNTPPKWFWPWR